MSRTQHPFQIYRAMLFDSPTKGHMHLTEAYEQCSYYYYYPNPSQNMSMQAKQQSNDTYNINFAVCCRQYGWMRPLHISDGKPPDCAISMTLINVTRLAYRNLKRRIKIVHLLPTCRGLPRKPPKAFVGPHLALMLGLGNEAQSRLWGTTKCLYTVCGSVPCVSNNITEAISVIQCSVTPSSD